MDLAVYYIRSWVVFPIGNPSNFQITRSPPGTTLVEAPNFSISNAVFMQFQP